VLGTSLRAKQGRRQDFAGWHQDTAYAEVKPIVVIVALALHRRGRTMAASVAFLALHRGPLLSHKEAFSNRQPAVTRAVHRTPHSTRHAPWISSLIPAGSRCSNNAIIHSSKPNFGNDRRILFSARNGTNAGLAARAAGVGGCWYAVGMTMATSMPDPQTADRDGRRGIGRLATRRPRSRQACCFVALNGRRARYREWTSGKSPGGD